MRKVLALGSLLVLPVCVAPRIAAADEAKADGDRLFRSKCASCHGADGLAKTKQAEKMKIRSFKDAELKSGMTEAKIKETILKGLAKTLPDGTKQEMKPLEGKIKPEEVDALVAHVKGLK